MTVEVADENGDAGASIVVGGYSLSGSVITDGQPTSGVNFILHTKDSLAAEPGKGGILQLFSSRSENYFAAVIVILVINWHY